MLLSEFSGERCEKNVVDGEMKNGIPQKVFGKERPSFLLGANENPAMEKSRHSQFFFVFFPAFSFNLKMSSSPLAAALASLFSSGSAQRCSLLPRSLLGFIQRLLATVGFVVSSQLNGG